jgi:hypothetical protein
MRAYPFALSTLSALLLMVLRGGKALQRNPERGLIVDFVTAACTGAWIGDEEKVQGLG